MRFEFVTAPRIVFGSGVLTEIGGIAKSSGQRALVVTGSKPERAARLIELLHRSGVIAVPFAVAGEPGLMTVENGVALASRERCDLVISIGGGSVIDAGKAIAAMMTNSGEVLDYLEIIGRGKSRPSLHSPRWGCAPL